MQSADIFVCPSEAVAFKDVMPYKTAASIGFALLPEVGRARKEGTLRTSFLRDFVNVAQNVSSGFLDVSHSEIYTVLYECGHSFEDC